MGKHMRDENIDNNARIINKRNKTKKVNGFAVFVLTIILCIAIVAGYFAPKVKNRIDKLGGGAQGTLAMMLGHNEETLMNLEKVYIVLIGESGTDDYKLSDTLMIASYDPKTQKASIMSIPRDTYVGSNKNVATGNYKINSRYKNGEEMDTLLSDLERITGLELNYYIRIDTKALINLVDLIGGVEFDVPINMKYDDPTQNLHINLKKGLQTLNGKQAEQLLRFRHNNNGTTYPAEYGMEDFGRMRTQREFIAATLQQTLKPEHITKINELINIGYENLNTNIKMEKMIDYVPYAVNFNIENLKTGELPGKSEQSNGIWIFTYDKKETQKLVQELFLDEETQVSEEQATEKQNSDTKKQENKN